MTNNLFTPALVVERDEQPISVVLTNQVSNTPEIGKGIPAGGTTKQSLVKASNKNYDAKWETVEGGGAGGSVETTLYVNPVTGEDTNSGLSWSTALKTIPTALEKLPATGETLPGGRLVRPGHIELSNGMHEIKSELIREEKIEFVGGLTYKIVGGKNKKFHGSLYVKVNIEGGEKLASAKDVGKIMVNPLTPKGTGVKGGVKFQHLGHFESAEIVEFWKGSISSEGHQVKEEGNPKASEYFTMSIMTRKNIVEYMMILFVPCKLGTGVTISGQGQMSGTSGRKGHHSPTEVVDSGNGLTFWAACGTPQQPIEARNTLRNFTLRGLETRPYRNEKGAGEYRSTMPIWGYFTQNSFNTLHEKLFITNYTGWGVYIGNNAAPEYQMQNCLVYECGNVSSKIGPTWSRLLTGGIWSEGGTPVQTLINNNFLNCWGVCAAISGGHMVGNSFNHAGETLFTEGSVKVMPASGTNLLTGGGFTPSNIVGGWMEGGVINSESQGGYTLYMGVHFQGIPGEIGATQSFFEEEEEQEFIEPWEAGKSYSEGELVEYKIEKTSNIWESTVAENKGNVPSKESEFWTEIVPAEYGIAGGCVAINCYFRRHSKGAIKEQGSEPIFWMNCRCQPKIKGVPYVLVDRTGSEGNVPGTSAFGWGRVGGKEVSEAGVVNEATQTTIAFVPKPVTIEAGKIFENGGHDVRLFVPVEYEEGGKIEKILSGETEAGFSNTFIHTGVGKNTIEVTLNSFENVKFVPTKAKILSGSILQTR